MSSDNLLKGFGVGADVAGQIATAVALRRKSSEKSLTSSLQSTVENVNGQISELEGVVADNSGEIKAIAITTNPQDIPHSLGRVPAGALLLQTDVVNLILNVTNVSETDITVQSAAANVVIWIL